MKKSRFTEEQIIGILKQHEAGVKTADLCREHGVSAATSYGWKSKSGGMDVIIAWELLNRVTMFPQLRPPVRATLECIRSLGPDHAVKERAFTASDDPDAWKRERGRRPILDPKVIAQSMGVSKAKVHQYLREARIMLRQVIIEDGKLFLTR
jgi:hypothetical protein